jgi:hypothetical protein
MRPFGLNRPSALLLFGLPLFLLEARAQERWFTREGEIAFTSHTTMETVRAENRTVACFFNPMNRLIEVSALVKGFEFQKASMQEQFNRELMESDTWPKVIFNGKVLGFVNDVLDRPGPHSFLVAGNLTFHGKTRKMVQPSLWTRAADGTVNAECNFRVRLSEHDVRVPSVFTDVIPDTVDIRVRLSFKEP